jgi:zinc D-Ala-D-Ala carboxypeptidase
MRALAITPIIALVIALAAPFAAMAKGKSEPLHTAFTLTRDDLPQLATGLPAEMAALIAKDPRAFLDRLVAVLDGQQDLLVLVDKQHALAKTAVPPDLVSVSRYPLVASKTGLQLRAVLMADLVAMAKDCKAAGATLVVSSTYRSFERQVAIIQEDLKTQSKEEVDRLVAPPGHSQHQLGTAIDFGSIDVSFAGTAAGQWMFANAWRYGFSLSYPEGAEQLTGYAYEPWHYRYVGKPAAAFIRDFFGDSQQTLLSWYALRRPFIEEHRKK